MKIFLVGFMGSGKTTMGCKLARKLGYDFIDLDQVLEEQAGMSIHTYFSQFGELSFRQLESAILKQSVYWENKVVATGGGLPCFFDHMCWMNHHGITVHLQAPVQVIVPRLRQSDTDKRPLLKGREKEVLPRYIEEKMAKRIAFYQMATLTVNAVGLDLHHLTRQLPT